MSGATASRAVFGAALGATVDGARTRFAAWTTRSRTCAVRFVDEHGAPLATHAMEPRGDGLFRFETGDAPHGSLYRFVLDGRERTDPYARFLPRGVHGPAMVWEPLHAWRHPCVPIPLADQVLYEIHAGAFTPEGTWEAALGRLDHLRALGITTLELMPVSAFAGTRGWGYDGVAHFAPHAPYGTPDDLRRFVDEAHARGLAVILDVVYNHFGPSGNALPHYGPEYFRDGVPTPWGVAPNFAHPAMRAYAIDNARFWLESFRFDGLRLDATQAITDESESHVLAEIAAVAAAFDPPRVVIAEDDRHEPDLVLRHRLDGMWVDDFHHAVHVTLTGERDGYYRSYRGQASEIARTIQGAWLAGHPNPNGGHPRPRAADGLPASAFLYYLQNHDQVGNRALGERLSDLVPAEAYAMASMVLLFLPMTPLLFMGQEWSASTPFLYFTDHEPALGEKVARGRIADFREFRGFADAEARARIPHPQEQDTFARSRLLWEEREVGHHGAVLDLYRKLLAFRRDDPVMRGSAGLRPEVRAAGDVLVVRRTHGGASRVLHANFSPSPVSLDALPHAPGTRPLLATAALADTAMLPGLSARIAEPAA